MSDTPETDLLCGEVVPAKFAGGLERERDEALTSLSELYAALIRYEGDVDGEAPSEHRRMMGRAAALLTENTLGPASTAGIEPPKL